jgi:resuscitation-promoting factor RpfA
VSATNERHRWPLTDLESFLVVLMVVVAFFLAAMALGGSYLPLFLISVLLLVVAGLTVVLLRRHHKAITHEIATAYVLTVSPVPVGAIVGKCDMKLRVNLRGRPPVDVKHHTVALATERWPRVGQTLPVDVGPNAKHLRVRWDLIDQAYLRAPDPTPPRPYRATGSDAGQRDAPPVRLHTQYADPDMNEDLEDPAFGGNHVTVRNPAPQAKPMGASMAGDRRDPDGTHEFDILPHRADHGRSVRTDAAPPAVIHPDFDPAEVDRSDFEPDPTVPREAPTIPTPRPAEQPRLRISGPGTTVPAGDEPTTGDGGQDRDGASIGGMLIVSDLDRSLRFYSETLGFTIVYAASGNAVVEYGGSRILLQHMAAFSGIDRKAGHLHIQVPDLEAAYTELVAKGVAFRYRPKMVSRSDEVELWKAAFDDPDGHGVALAEWRHRR